MSDMIYVKQVKSLIAVPKKLKKVVTSLGLKGIGHEKAFKDNNCIRGMVNKVSHLVQVRLSNK